MEPKRSKYDTNPLDPGVGERATNSFESTRPGPPTEEVRSGPTFEIGSQQGEVESYGLEAPTQLIDDKVTAYPSIFVPPKPRERPAYDPPRVSYEKIYQPPPVPPPNVYQPPAVIPVYPPRSTKVAGLGIPEKWAVTLPYLPFYLAIVIAVVELFLVPRSESRTRFHASQALTLQIGITAISMILSLGSLFTDRWTGASLFNFASFIFLIIAMVRVYKGKTMVIPPLDDWRKWFDEKIKPRKKAGFDGNP